nr:LytTR family DNA-binding domain-containing protein [uncultured Carboxylicivirga sp.]
MYKIVIAEDEFNAREVLRKMLSLLFPQIEVIAEFSSFTDTKEFLSSNTADIVLFDIELDDGPSVEMLKDYPEAEFETIFVTSYKKYAIDAIKLSAVDYILKPVDPNELKAAIDKAILKINDKKEMIALKEIEKQKEETHKKVVIKTYDNTYYLDAESIIYLEAEGAYTTIFTSDRKILTSKNLKHYESLLKPYNFARTHQKYIVNLNQVISIDTNADIILNNGYKAKVSVRRKSELVKQLNL